MGGGVAFSVLPRPIAIPVSAGKRATAACRPRIPNPNVAFRQATNVTAISAVGGIAMQPIGSESITVQPSQQAVSDRQHHRHPASPYPSAISSASP